MAETATEEKVEELEGGANEPAAAEVEEAREAPAEPAPIEPGLAPGAPAPGEEREPAGSGQQTPSAGRGLEFLGAIELEAAVELGRTTLTIGEVLELGPGSVVQLDKMLGDPVEMMVKDRLIARGEVVVVDDKFGLRVTEIVPRGGE